MGVDIKRPAVSGAARDNQLTDKGPGGRRVRAYRVRLHECSQMSPLEVWYDRLDAQTIIDMAPNAKIRKFREQIVAQAQQRIGDYLYPKISGEVGGRRRLIDQPPVLYHISAKGFERSFMRRWQRTDHPYPTSAACLSDRYRLEDIAIKAVGIGSGVRFVGCFSPRITPCSCN
jgi:hypothetical protein